MNSFEFCYHVRKIDCVAKRTENYIQRTTLYFVRFTVNRKLHKKKEVV